MPTAKALTTKAPTTKVPTAKALTAKGLTATALTAKALTDTAPRKGRKNDPNIVYWEQLARTLVDAGPYFTSHQADCKAIIALLDAAQECRRSDIVNTRWLLAHILRMYQQLTERQFWDKVILNVMRDQTVHWGAGRCVIYNRKVVQLQQRQTDE